MLSDHTSTFSSDLSDRETYIVQPGHVIEESKISSSCLGPTFDDVTCYQSTCEAIQIFRVVIVPTMPPGAGANDERSIGNSTRYDYICTRSQSRGDSATS